MEQMRLKRLRIMSSNPYNRVRQYDLWGAWYCGYGDFNSGTRLADNPYRQEDLRRGWSVGYRSAEEDFTGCNPA